MNENLKIVFFVLVLPLIIYGFLFNYSVIKAEDILEVKGYSDIKIIGIVGYNKDDCGSVALRRIFEAKFSGEKVTGYVCVYGNMGVQNIYHKNYVVINNKEIY